MTKCQALDIFVLAHGKATSVVNESYICGDNNSTILNQCNAVKLWSKGIGLETEISIPWKQLYASHINFQKTSLPNVRIQNIDQWIKKDSLRMRVCPLIQLLEKPRVKLRKDFLDLPK